MKLNRETFDRIWKSFSKYSSSALTRLALLSIGIFAGYKFCDWGYLRILTDNESKPILTTIITITGIAAALVFSILIQKYAEAKGSFEKLYTELLAKQRVLNIFRELCYGSMTSYDIWRSLGYTYRKNEKKGHDESSPKHKHPYAVLLYQAICDAGDRCYDGYHESDKGRKPLTYTELESLRDQINTIWYLLERPGPRKQIIEFLTSCGNEKLVLISDDPSVELMAQKVNRAENIDYGHFTTLSYWHGTSGHIASNLCGEMLRIQAAMYELSPNRYIDNFKNTQLLLFAGIFLPIILLAFNYQLPWNLFSTLFYIDICLLVYSLAKILNDSTSILQEDIFEKRIGSE